jgi:hypothetical protein
MFGSRLSKGIKTLQRIAIFGSAFSGLDISVRYQENIKGLFSIGRTLPSQISCNASFAFACDQ